MMRLVKLLSRRRIPFTKLLGLPVLITLGCLAGTPPANNAQTTTTASGDI